MSLRTTSLRPLWRCPRCGARFVTSHLFHACGRYTLKDLFARSDRHVLTLFNKFEPLIRSCGRVVMIPQKTRVVFMVRGRMKEMGFPGFLSGLFVRGIPKLERWKKS